jgi:hypothetical protein
MQTRTRARARAKIAVQTSEAIPYDQTAGPALLEVRLTETFTGDIEGESPVRALQVLRDDKSACLVSLQRFRGKLGRRQGSFVLQGSEIVENGKIKGRWSVVPGSGTGGFSGAAWRGRLRGRVWKRVRQSAGLLLRMMKLQAADSGLRAYDKLTSRCETDSF